MIRVEHRHEVVVRAVPGHGREIVGAIDRRPVEDVVGARDDDRPDLGGDEALQLGGDALHRAARLDVRVEQVPGDQEEIDLLGEGEIDGGLERRELALPLGGRLFAEIVVSRAEMDVCGMDEPQHPVVRLASLASRSGRPAWSLRHPIPVGSEVTRARRPHDSPLAAPTVGWHCDRYGVNVTGRIRSVEGLFRRAVVSCRSLHRCAPRQGLHIGTWVARPRLYGARPRISRPPKRPPAIARTCADQRASEEHRDLRRSNPELCRLWSGVHPFGGRSGVLRPEGVRQRPEALHQLPGQPAGLPRWWVRRPRDRWAARL